MPLNRRCAVRQTLPNIPFSPILDRQADTLVHIWGTDSWQRAPTGQHIFRPGDAPGCDETHGVSVPMGTVGADKGSGKKGEGLGKHGWTREEDETIVRMVQITGQKWSRIAAVLPGRTDDAVRNRYLRLQRKKAHEPGAPVTQDDLVECETAKKGDMWTPEEDAAIMNGVSRIGLKWQQIATALPGRSANAVRNRYLRCLPQGTVDALKPKHTVKSTHLAGGMLRPAPTAACQVVGAALESGRRQLPPRIRIPQIQPTSDGGAFSFSSQASGALADNSTGTSACNGCISTTAMRLVSRPLALSPPNRRCLTHEPTPRRSLPYVHAERQLFAGRPV